MDEERLLPTEVVAGENDLHLGLVPSALPPGIVCVQKVEPESWAERAGVQVGSEIRAINGKDVATMKGEAFRIHLKKRPVQFMLLPRSRAEQERAEEERRRAEADLRRLEEERSLFAKVREDMEDERRRMEEERKRMEEERERIEDERRRAEAELKELQDRLAREDEERRLKELKKQEEEARLKEQEAMRRKEQARLRRERELEERRREEELLRLQQERLLAESVGPAPWDYGSYQAAKPVLVASGQRASVRLQEEIPSERKELAYQVNVDASAAVLGIIPRSWPPNEVCVGSVVANSAAADHGVQVDDVLVSLDGELVQKMSRSVLDSLLRKRPVVLGMTRKVSTSLTDGASSERVNKPETMKAVADAGNYEVSFNFDDRVLGFIPGTWPPGPVQVSAVVPDSSAQRLGVRSGDALVSLNGRDVMGMHRRELLAALRERPLKMVFLRGPGAQAVATHMATEAIAEAMDEADLPDFSYTTAGGFMTSWVPPHIQEKQRNQLATMKIQMQKPKEEQLTLAQRAIRYGTSKSADDPEGPEEGFEQNQEKLQQQERLSEQQQQKRESGLLSEEPSGKPTASSGDKLRESLGIPSGGIARSDENVQPISNPSDFASAVNEADAESMPIGERTPPVPPLNLEGVGTDKEKDHPKPFQKKMHRTRNAAFVKMLGEFSSNNQATEAPEKEDETKEASRSLRTQATEKEDEAKEASRSLRTEALEKEDEAKEVSRSLSKGFQRVRRVDRAVSLFHGLGSSDPNERRTMENDPQSSLQETSEQSTSSASVGTASKRLRKVRQLDITSMLRPDVAVTTQDRVDKEELVKDEEVKNERVPPIPPLKNLAPERSGARPEGNLRQNVGKVKKLNVAAMVQRGVTEDSAGTKFRGKATTTLTIPGEDGSGPNKAVPKWVVSADSKNSDVALASQSEPGSRPLPTPQLGEKRANGLKIAKEWMREPRQASPIKPSRVAAMLESARKPDIIDGFSLAESTWKAADREHQMQRLAKIRSKVAEEDEAVLADLEAAAFLLELGADPAPTRFNARRRQEQDVSLAAAALLAELSPEMELQYEDWQRHQENRTAVRREMEVPSKIIEDRTKFSVRV